MNISFFIPGIPVAKGRARMSARGGFARAYTPAKTRKAEKDFATLASAFAPATPLECPLSLQLTFYFPIPSSFTKWKQEAAANGKYHHVTRPDLDNCIKLVKDSLNGLFFLDDRQVSGIIASKWYARDPYTTVRITTLDQPQKEIERLAK